jgi:MFS family permease
MDMVTRGWLIYTLTGSALLLGAIWATRGLPLLLLTLIGGVAADRFDRKRQLILAQNVNAILNCILAVLVLTGLVEVWHVFVTAFFSGAAVAFQQPARQSLIPRTVTKDDLDNAVALNSTVLNLTRALGPMLGGLSVGLLGIAGGYACQAGLLFCASVWTRQIRLHEASGRVGRKRRDEGWWTSLANGFHYSMRHPTVMPLLLLGLLPTLLAQPWTTLAPVFAEDVFQIGAEGLGLLLPGRSSGSAGIRGTGLHRRLWRGTHRLRAHLVPGARAALPGRRRGDGHCLPRDQPDNGAGGDRQRVPGTGDQFLPA